MKPLWKLNEEALRRVLKPIREDMIARRTIISKETINLREAPKDSKEKYESFEYMLWGLRFGLREVSFLPGESLFGGIRRSMVENQNVVPAYLIEVRILSTRAPVIVFTAFRLSEEQGMLLKLK